MRHVKKTKYIYFLSFNLFLRNKNKTVWNANWLSGSWSCNASSSNGSTTTKTSTTAPNATSAVTTTSAQTSPNTTLTTKTPTSISNQDFDQNMSLSNTTFSFEKLTVSQITTFLQTNMTNNCLRNCSSQGKCLIQGNSFSCSCDLYFAGLECAIDTRPCAQYPCTNNATCVQDLEAMTYTCECARSLYGSRCELQVDVCANETCSGNGICYHVDNSPACKCFNAYSGERCQIVSPQRIIQKSVVSVATVVAILIMVSLVGLLLLMDMDTFRKTCRPKRFVERRVRKKFIYRD